MEREKVWELVGKHPHVVEKVLDHLDELSLDYDYDYDNNPDPFHQYIPWNEGLIKKYLNDSEIRNLSKSESIKWTNSLIEVFKSNLSRHDLAMNKSVYENVLMRSSNSDIESVLKKTNYKSFNQYYDTVPLPFDDIPNEPDY